VTSDARNHLAFDRRIGRRVRFDEPQQATWSPTGPLHRRRRLILVRMIDVSVTGALFEAQATTGIQAGCRGDLRIGDRAGFGVIRRVEPGGGNGSRRCSAEFLDNELSSLPYQLAAGVCADGELFSEPVAVPRTQVAPREALPPSAVALSPGALGRPLRRRDLLGG
jgi:hypothetical protein